MASGGRGKLIFDKKEVYIFNVSLVLMALVKYKLRLHKHFTMESLIYNMFKKICKSSFSYGEQLGEKVITMGCRSEFSYCVTNIGSCKIAFPGFSQMIKDIHETYYLLCCTY